MSLFDDEMSVCRTDPGAAHCAFSGNGASRNRDSLVTTIREASPDDLPSVNHVVRSAIMSWSISDRLKRLSLPIYSYSLQDMQHLSMFVAEDETGIIGVAACEPADRSETPLARQGMLLHGIYVRSDCHGQGVGSHLLSEARRHARRCGADGMLVKAHSEARSFFSAQGLCMLPVDDPDRDYPYRFWTERLPTQRG